MERRKLFIVITLLLFILFLVVYLIFFTALGKKLAGIYKPRLLESEKDVQDTVVCDPMTSIQKCTNVGDPCIQCKDGLYSCQEITGPDVTLENAKGQKYLVPDGTWCLPTAVSQPSPCNTFTSIPIVTKVTDSLYKWRCYCKYPNWVASSGLDEDCDVQIACNHQRNPAENYLVYCKSGASSWDDATKKFVCSDKSDPVKWESATSEVNLEDTLCHCEPGSFYYENKELGVKECVKNPCGAGKGAFPFYRSDTGELDCSCDTSGCPDGVCPKSKNKGTCQISCSELPDDKKGECAIGCIDDPCRESGGLFDVGSHQCTCCCTSPGPPPKGSKVPSCLKGDVFMPDDNFLGGGFCQNVDDACAKMTTSDGKNSCTDLRGGKCTTCPTKTGLGATTFVSTPYCYDCQYSKGFRPEPETIDCGANPQNCDTCTIWFAECSKDDDCCTGRCHDNKLCKPCNETGIESGDSPGDKAKKQQDWDKECASLSSTRVYCNSYDVGKGWDYWSSDGLLGFCEATTPKAGSGGTRY